MDNKVIMTGKNAQSYVFNNANNAVININNQCSIETNEEKSEEKSVLDDVYDLTMKICQEFKHQVEDMRMGQEFYREGKKPTETSWQMLFNSIAISYTQGGKNNVHITREANPGVGEIDFQVTCGEKANVCIEMKRSSNSYIYHGYTEQLPAYMRAERAERGIFIIIEEDDKNKKQITEVLHKKEELENEGRYAPEVIIINGRYQPSASKPNYKVNV